MKALICSILILCLSACATDVHRFSDSQPEHQVVPVKVTAVTISFSDDGKRDYADNSQFDPNILISSINNKLQANQLLVPANGDSLEVQITAIRVRSTFNAVMWGFMAGSDNVKGQIYVRDASGKIVQHYEVYAMYALGGLVGGIESVRWGYLYDKFADLAVSNLNK